MNRFKWWYSNVVLFDYLYKTQVDNPYNIPKLSTVCINAGVKQGVSDPKSIIPILFSLKCISNQKPVYTLAKKSIANYKLRKGFPIGVKVTLRNCSIDYFVDQLINIVLPRVRDFRGLRMTQFDSSGNLTIGIQDIFLFPQVELYYDILPKDLGCSITVNVTHINYIPNNAYCQLISHNGNDSQNQKWRNNPQVIQHNNEMQKKLKEWYCLLFACYQMPFLTHSNS
jgi:large subunit ribosomal protein L5